VNVRNERIAIVGIGIRYPDAASPQELWENVCAGRRAFRPLSAARKKNAADHSLRLALDTAAAALADAGLPGSAAGFTVDGVRSSSPLTVVRAADALVAGDLDVAVAGGVDSFDVLGCGMVVLMREADALARGCRIYASITGWGVASDGVGALTRAHEHAGYGVETVSYFEGRGGVTEIHGLSSVRQAADPTVPTAAFGTIAGTLGDARAAGTGGLIKAALAVHHQVIPPVTGPHPMLIESDAAVHVPTDAALWPADVPVRAGVSATGPDGANTHLALAEAPGRERRAGIGSWTTALVAGRQDAELLLVDAHSAADLLVRLTRLSELAATLSFAELTDLAGTLALQPRGGAFRAAVVAVDPAGAARALTRLAGELAAGRDTLLFPADGAFLAHRTDAPRIAYLFPGQGAGRGDALRRRFAVAERLFGMADTHGRDEAGAPPRVVAGSLAGLRALHTLGIDADIAVGHGLGELTALSWGGALDGGDVLRLAAVRGQVMALAGRDLVSAGHRSAAPTVITGPAGAMAARLATFRFHRLRRPVVSTVTGSRLAADADLRALLVDQLVEPVRFPEAAAEAVAGVDLAIEVGPGRALSGLVAGTAPDTLALAMETDSTTLSPLLTVAAAAFALGADLDPTALFADRVIRPITAAEPWVTTKPAPNRQETAETLDVLRRLTAEQADVAPATVTARTDPLDDLLLSPPTIRHIVDDATRALDRPTLAATTNLATVTLGALAGMIDHPEAPARDDAAVRATLRRGAGPWAPSLLGPYLARATEVVLGGARTIIVATGRQAETVTVTGSGGLACAVDVVAERTEDDWDTLLGSQQRRVRDLVAAETGESDSVAATRVLSALKCLRTAGISTAALTLDRVEPAGWVVLSDGESRIATWVTTVHGVPEQVVFTVLSGKTDMAANNQTTGNEPWT
jgi:enediyne polyketide synthase